MYTITVQLNTITVQSYTVTVQVYTIDIQMYRITVQMYTISITDLHYTDAHYHYTDVHHHGTNVYYCFCNSYTVFNAFNYSTISYNSCLVQCSQLQYNIYRSLDTIKNYESLSSINFLFLTNYGDYGNLSTFLKQFICQEKNPLISETFFFLKIFLGLFIYPLLLSNSYVDAECLITLSYSAIFHLFIFVKS